MNSTQQDLSVFNKFDFETPPVGVKFSPHKPDGIAKLDKILDLCEMLKEAQDGNSFYATKEEFTCVGPLLLGMIEHEPAFESGMVGPRLEVYKDDRANRKVYQYIPRLGVGSINYIACAPLDKLSFEPDVLIVMANPAQAEILIRAHSYTSGEMWHAKGTPVIGCAWLFVHPYVSGEMNFTVTGFGFGMRARGLFREGMLLVSIPWNLLPEMVQNLKEMNWVPHSYTIGREAHKKKVRGIAEELAKETGV
jgi:uncharacterized protein (DUF169 family)